MRIALVIYGSLDRVSGGFIYDRALVHALAGLGHQVDVIALPWHGYARAVAGSVARRLAPRFAPRFAPRSPRSPAAATAPYDVVIEDELIHPSIFARPGRGAWPASGLRLALVHNLHSGQPDRRFRRLATAVERRYLGTVDGAIAVCERTRDDLQMLAGAPLPTLVAYPGRDHVAPAVDDTSVAARSAEAGPLRILHVAAVTPAKGLTRLLAALARAAETRALDFTLDVAGQASSPAYQRVIHRRVTALGLQGRVRLRGQLRGAALHALYRGSQLFALPSDREAYSLACLEALGHGLPVLATSAGGLGEMIADGREGFLIAPHETDRWAAALADLGADRARLRAMAGAALRRYRRHATWSQVAATVQDFVQDLSRDLSRDLTRQHLAARGARSTD